MISFSRFSQGSIDKRTTCVCRVSCVFLCYMRFLLQMMDILCNRQEVQTHLHIWALGRAVNARQVSTPRIVLISVQLLICFMREPTGECPNAMAMKRMQRTKIFWDTFERHGRTLSLSCFVSCMLVRYLCLSEFVLR